MPRSQSRTHTSIWSDSDFTALTGRAQRLYWLLYSQPTITLCGVLALTEQRWARLASDETLETVRAALDELETARFIVVDRDTQEVFIRSFARYDGVRPDSTVWHTARRQAEQVLSTGLRAAAIEVLDYIEKVQQNTLFDRVSEGGSDTHRARRAGSSASVPVLRPLPPSPSQRAAIPVENLQLLDPNTGQTGASAPNGQNPTGRYGQLHPQTVPGGHETGQQLVTLAHRLSRACTTPDASIALAEATSVIRWAGAHIDHRLIDEAIGWAETRPRNARIRYPRGVARTIKAKAADHGITMPDYDPRMLDPRYRAQDNAT